ncbi:atp-dependent protease la [Nannochloropsis gaditana]|uniref:Atp-dependent protease la n=1 Tax=Nannochloropsis gaditana TaxID=72520 RepID=W7TV02_9STRA|nr:atp-dependent protease la [Nannochloropsis gaditana]
MGPSQWPSSGSYAFSLLALLSSPRPSHTHFLPPRVATLQSPLPPLCLPPLSRFRFLPRPPQASPSALADELVTHLNVPLEAKQRLLEEPRLEARLRGALELIREQVEIIKLSSKISNEVEDRLSTRQREYYLRQQLKTIKEQLGEEEDGSEEDDMTELANRLKAKPLPREVRVAAEKELRRLKRMQPSQPEHSVVRTYLEWILDLPWFLKDDENEAGDTDAQVPSNVEEAFFDVRAVEAQLDRDHHGLGKVKRRILEYIAVRSLTRSLKGPILCLVGPPGVGKTSLGRSIATALGRRFQRLSLGGVHDEAEIRGHRRTYIGALPGNILQCMKKAGTPDPLFLLDEVDKLGSSIRGGDPSAAMLEVLDPEQNSTFTDHYLNLPYDLSRVFFLATANQTDTIPEPLLDRMEVINLPGYTIEEKVFIAEQYLIPKQLAANGLSPEHVIVTPR